MNKQAAIILVICYLFLSITFVNAHNHPISEGESDHCPVYIISHSFYSDSATNNIILIEYVPKQNEYLIITNDDISCHIIYSSINTRAPPFSDQIWLSFLKFN